MQAAVHPADEPGRLRALDAYHVLDTPAEEAFDDLTRLAAAICGTPMALISLIDSKRQWFKSRVGIEVPETPRDVAFCAHAILQDDLFVVPDAAADERFADNPLVVRTPNIRFYAGAPLLTPSGHALGTLCVLDTQARELTPEQRAALGALARQTIVQLELRRQLPEPDELEQLKKEFISTVSHELRTPLTSIRGALGLLAAGVAGELNEEARALLVVAERNSVRLMTLVDDILDVEKLESGTLAMELAPTPLERIVGRSLDSISPVAEKEGVRIDVDCSDAVVQGDEERLTQVTVNLLSNAVKHSPRGGTVRLQAVELQECVEVRVEDGGDGIPAAAQPKLFRSFQQIDARDARAKGGSGLGLAICRGIIERHGGSIGVQSREGHGSTFWFRVPKD